MRCWWNEVMSGWMTHRSWRRVDDPPKMLSRQSSNHTYQSWNVYRRGGWMYRRCKGQVDKGWVNETPNFVEGLPPVDKHLWRGGWIEETVTKDGEWKHRWVLMDFLLLIKTSMTSEGQVNKGWVNEHRWMSSYIGVMRMSIPWMSTPSHDMEVRHWFISHVFLE